MSSRALIFGVSGQDGAYLSKFLLSKNYEIMGAGRDTDSHKFENLESLGIKKDVHLVSAQAKDYQSIIKCLQSFLPDEVYNLSGVTSVAFSFEQPVETFESISVGTWHLLEALRQSKKPIKFYNAGSSECFGNTHGQTANEETPFRPRSPYGVAKSAAFWQVANFREAYNLYACSGILFNHESPLRPDRFVTKKIVSTTCRIKNGSKERLVLGNLNISRDWGWAPEYVEAMWKMLQQKTPDDYVIATGETNSLEDFVAETFSQLGLVWKEFVTTDAKFMRPTDIQANYANPKKAEEKLNWKAKSKMKQVIQKMIEAELQKSD